MPFLDLKTDTLVEVQRTAQVLRIDAEGSMVHPQFLKHLQAAGK
jgi:hypothetical protein